MKLYFSHVYWGSAFVVILSLVSVVSPLECRIGHGQRGRKYEGYRVESDLSKNKVLFRGDQ